MDATCTIQDSIHVFSLVHKYVSRILGTYHISWSLMLQLINLMRPIVMMTIPKVEYPLCQN